MGGKRNSRNKRKRVTIQVDFQDMGSHLSFMHKIRYNVKIIYSDLYKYLRKRHNLKRGIKFDIEK